MATTTTRTSVTILADYELHHSQAGRDTAPADSTAARPPNQAPEWDTSHRRVPEYRPINRDRDQSEVRVYRNPIERAFITVMFTGLFANATAAKLWRKTLGKLNDRIFRYKVGGEL